MPFRLIVAAYFTWILTPDNTRIRSKEQNYGRVSPRCDFTNNTVSKLQLWFDVIP